MREGQASILQRANDVFFNPVQVINRDMSIAVLKYFIQQRQEELASGKLKLRRRAKGGVPTAPAGGEGTSAAADAAAGGTGATGLGVPEEAAAGVGAVSDSTAAAAGETGAGEAAAAAAAAAAEEQPGSSGVRILEGLAASGLRAIRYAIEIEGVAEVLANDLDPNVVAALRQNIEWNGGLAVEKVTPSVGDARLVALQVGEADGAGARIGVAAAPARPAAAGPGDLLVNVLCRMTTTAHRAVVA